MKNVLMICLEFGPVQTTGAFRSLDFVRHLPEFGVRPHVLTIDPDHGEKIFNARRNDALLSSLPLETDVQYLVPSKTTPLNESAARRYLRLLTSFGDGFFERFREPLSNKVNELRRITRLDAVYASAPPFGAARLGEEAARQLGVPFILDMRDAWSEWTVAPHTTYLHYRATLRAESRAFAAASKIVTVTDALAEVFRESHPSVEAGKFSIIPNGFDGPLFDPGELSVANSEKGSFDIAYLGSYYYTPSTGHNWLRPHRWLQYQRPGEDWSYRSPKYFFAAWKLLLERNPSVGARIRFHHIGAAPQWLIPLAAQYGVQEHCTLHGVLPKQEVGSALSKMDALLGTSMKRDRQGDYCLSSKTFDYLRAGKPVIAFVTPGAQRGFYAAAGNAVFADPDDVVGASAVLEAIANGRCKLTLKADFVNQFSRSATTKQLASVLLAS